MLQDVQMFRSIRRCEGHILGRCAVSLVPVVPPQSPNTTKECSEWRFKSSRHPVLQHSLICFIFHSADNEAVDCAEEAKVLQLQTLLLFNKNGFCFAAGAIFGPFWQMISPAEPLLTQHVHQQKNAAPVFFFIPLSLPAGRAGRNGTAGEFFQYQN